jgi:arylsulfatase A-like enzyme
MQSLGRYALLGAVAAFLLSLIEWIDLQIQLTPVFASFTERLVLTTYLSLNILVGTLIGLLLGLLVYGISGLKDRLIAFISGNRKLHPLTGLLVGLFVCVVVAILFKQQPRLHAYLIELIREAEKVESIRNYLLNHERSTSYALMLGYVIGFWMMWRLARLSNQLKKPVKIGLLIILAALIAIFYYIDSRIEVQLYDPSMHRTLFIMNFALMMMLCSVIYYWSPLIQAIKFKPAVLILATVIVLGCGAFTFIHFDHNQNLKHQVAYRTTQTRQHIRLLQYLFDFDRDGWSSVLGGGDADDANAAIHPAQKEIVGDGVDNNGIGGDLTQVDIGDWNRQFELLHAAPAANAQHFNLIYIFVDALRADHLGTYGYGRNTSPNFDKFAEKSQVFENGFTPAPNTFEALPKFTQGVYWDKKIPGWPQLLASSGYNALLFPRRVATILRHVKGMKVVEESRQRSFQATIDTAIQVLGKSDPSRPFAAYLYSTDTHRPYVKHEQFNFGSALTDLYDGEVAYVDYHLGRLFDWLESSGHMKDTMVVIMADHAESLGERGVYKHSSQLYNEQLHIPYIIYVPNLAPRRIKDYVSSVDLSPTILHTLGFDFPQACAGVSLLPLMKGEAFTHPPVYAEQTYLYQSLFVSPEQNVHIESKKYAVITQDGYKLIFNRNPYTFELFNLKQDPQELHNLYDYEPEKAAEMKRLVGRYLDVVIASRQWDADESQYIYGKPAERDEVK